MEILEEKKLVAFEDGGAHVDACIQEMAKMADKKTLLRYLPVTVMEVHRYLHI